MSDQQARVCARLGPTDATKVSVGPECVGQDQDSRRLAASDGGLCPTDGDGGGRLPHRPRKDQGPEVGAGQPGGSQDHQTVPKVKYLIVKNKIKFSFLFFCQI